MVLSFKIPNIRCEGCVATIREALRKLPGISQVKADVSTKQVRIECDDTRVSEWPIREMLAAIGFPPE